LSEPVSNLRVEETISTEKVVRMRAEVLSHLGVKSKEIVAIRNQKGRITYSRCKLVHPDFLRPDAVSMNQVLQACADVAAGEFVEVMKAKPYDAQIVKLNPLGEVTPISEQFIAEELELQPTSVDETVTFPYFGEDISFQIIEIIPRVDNTDNGVVAVMTRETKVILLE
jgi:hypothetical protein